MAIEVGHRTADADESASDKESLDDETKVTTTESCRDNTVQMKTSTTDNMHGPLEGDIPINETGTSRSQEEMGNVFYTSPIFSFSTWCQKSYMAAQSLVLILDIIKNLPHDN
jgi:hypothetical protein